MSRAWEARRLRRVWTQLGGMVGSPRGVAGQPVGTFPAHGRVGTTQVWTNSMVTAAPGGRGLELVLEEEEAEACCSGVVQRSLDRHLKERGKPSGGAGKEGRE